MDLILSISIALIATYSTFYLTKVFKQKSVLASSLIILIAAITFPYIFRTTSQALIAVVACSSYAAMIVPDKLNPVIDLFVIGLLVGIFLNLSTQSFVGIGGKLGAIGALACLTLIGLKEIKKVVLSTPFLKQNTIQTKRSKP